MGIKDKKLKQKIRKRRKLKRRVRIHRFLVRCGLSKRKENVIEYDTNSQEKLVNIVERLIRDTESNLTSTIHSENLYIKNGKTYVIITPKIINLVNGKERIASEPIFEDIYKRLSHKFSHKLESKRKELDELISKKIEEIIDDINEKT